LKLQYAQISLGIERTAYWTRPISCPEKTTSPLPPKSEIQSVNASAVAVHYIIIIIIIVIIIISSWLRHCATNWKAMGWSHKEVVEFFQFT
jgi:hypothetical protein